MGEAWSDWYALDYLVNQGSSSDTAEAGDIYSWASTSAPGRGLIRTEADRLPGGPTVTGAAPARRRRARAATPTATSADVVGRPEVHADGEIWAQTLWDLRDALGSQR